jgi:hypothetical protein
VSPIILNETLGTEDEKDQHNWGEETAILVPSIFGKLSGNRQRTKAIRIVLGRPSGKIYVTRKAVGKMYAQL